MSRVSLAHVALGALSLAVVVAQPALAVLFVLLGLGLYTWSISCQREWSDHHTTQWGALIAIAVLALSLPLSRMKLPEVLIDLRTPGVVVGLAAAVLVLTGPTKLKIRRAGVVVGLLGVVVVTGIVVGSEWNSELGTDVYHAHRAAGAALLEGDNPYTDAVQFLDGSPYAPDGAVYEGYPYPPVVLVTYGVAAAFTDPRIVSVIAWFVVIGWAARSALVDRSEGRPNIALFLLLATTPGWPLLWYTAWTEPLSLMLFVIAALTWKRGPAISGITLGLALASKQYFVLLAPFLLLLRSDEERVRRLTVALLTVAATLAPALIADPAAFYQSTIGNLAGIGFRPDTISIPGVLSAGGWQLILPQWALLVIGLVVSGLLGHFTGSSESWLERAALAMAVYFALGLAFANYWFLIFGLLAASVVLGTRDQPGSNTTRSEARKQAASTWVQRLWPGAHTTRIAVENLRNG